MSGISNICFEVPPRRYCTRRKISGVVKKISGVVLKKKKKKELVKSFFSFDPLFPIFN